MQKHGIPYEGILILRGKSKKREIIIDGLVVPPFSSHGPYYSGFPVYDLPFDLSYIGMHTRILEIRTILHSKILIITSASFLLL